MYILNKEPFMLTYLPWAKAITRENYIFVSLVYKQNSDIFGEIKANIILGFEDGRVRKLV